MKVVSYRTQPNFACTPREHPVEMTSKPWMYGLNSLGIPTHQILLLLIYLSCCFGIDHFRSARVDVLFLLSTLCILSSLDSFTHLWRHVACLLLQQLTRYQQCNVTNGWGQKSAHDRTYPGYLTACCGGRAGLRAAGWLLRTFVSANSWFP